MTKKSKICQAMGFDPGHSTAKIVTEKQRVLFPTMATTGPIIADANGVFDADSSKKSIDNMEIVSRGETWYIGNIAKRSERHHDAPFGSAKYKDPDFLKLMLLAALSEVKLLDMPVVLVTAVPGKFSQDKALKEKVRQQLIGYHTVSRVKAKGRRAEKVVEVVEVHVRSEPGALLFSHILTPSGEFNEENFQPDMIYVTVDIGEHTTCINIYRGLNRLGDDKTHHSYTDVSMGRIYSEVAGQVEDETRRHLENWQVRDIIINGDGTIPLNVKGAVTRFDLKPFYVHAAERARRTLRTRVSQAISDVVDENSVDMILAGGGGAEPIGGVIKKIYDDRVLPCSQFDTSQGLYNFGVRRCQQILKK